MTDMADSVWNSPPPGEPPVSAAAEMLRLDRVTKTFGSTRVIDDLSLSVKKGEFVSILGPSGCGKSTSLRIIAGFMRPDSGSLQLDGKCIDNVPSHLRGAAMVFQNYALFPHLTVYDNVAFGPRMHKVPKALVAEKVAQALALVQMPDLGARYPRELSGGQQQRVALARAIALNPKLLLLDEPLSNLDAKLRKELRAEFLEIHRLAGITTLFVTHDIEEAFSISDRVAVMNRGRIEQFGTPVEIYTRPRTRFVADFVGHGNVIEGQPAIDGEGAIGLRFYDVFVKTRPTDAACKHQQFAIPGHCLRIARQPMQMENCFPARLQSLSYLGSSVQFRVRLGDKVIEGEAAATPDTIALRAGDDVYVGWKSTDMIELADEGVDHGRA